MNIKQVVIGTSLIAGVVALVYGLYQFYTYQISQALKYCYKISSVSFNKISLNNINMNVGVLIMNKSDFVVNLTGYSFDIYLNEKLITTAKSNQIQTIANNSVSEIVANVNFEPSKFFDLSYVAQLLIWAVNSKDKIVLQIKGSFSAKLNFIQIANYPVDFKMTLAEILAPEDPNNPKEKCDIGGEFKII